MPTIAHLDIQVTPEALENAPRILSQTLTATRAFDGNLGVDVIVDNADPHHFVVVEHWESVDADSAYRAFRTTPEGASELGTILAGVPKLTLFTTTDI